MNGYICSVWSLYWYIEYTIYYIQIFIWKEMKQIMRQFLNIRGQRSCLSINNNSFEDNEILFLAHIMYFVFCIFFYLEDNEILIARPDHVWIMWCLFHVPRHPGVHSLKSSAITSSSKIDFSIRSSVVCYTRMLHTS